jgi:hypothetical protein
MALLAIKDLWNLNKDEDECHRNCNKGLKICGSNTREAFNIGFFFYKNQLY